LNEWSCTVSTQKKIRRRLNASGIEIEDRISYAIHLLMSLRYCNVCITALKKTEYLRNVTYWWMKLVCVRRNRKWAVYHLVRYRQADRRCNRLVLYGTSWKCWACVARSMSPCGRTANWFVLFIARIVPSKLHYDAAEKNDTVKHHEEINQHEHSNNFFRFNFAG